MAGLANRGFHSLTLGVENTCWPRADAADLARTQLACNAVQTQLPEFCKLFISWGYKLEMNRRPVGLILDVLLIKDFEAFSSVEEGF